MYGDVCMYIRVILKSVPAGLDPATLRLTAARFTNWAIKPFFVKNTNWCVYKHVKSVCLTRGAHHIRVWRVSRINVGSLESASGHTVTSTRINGGSLDLMSFVFRQTRVHWQTQIATFPYLISRHMRFLWLLFICEQIVAEVSPEIYFQASRCAPTITRPNTEPQHRAKEWWGRQINWIKEETI